MRLLQQNLDSEMDRQRSLNERILSLSLEVDRAQTEANVLREQLHSSQYQVESLSQAVTELEGERDSLSLASQKLTKEIERKEKDLASAQSAESSWRRKMDTKLSSLNSDLEKEKQECETLRQEIHRLNHVLTEKERAYLETKQSMEEEIRQLDKRHAKLKSDCKEQTELVDQLRADDFTKSARLYDLEDTITSLKEQIHQSHRELEFYRMQCQRNDDDMATIADKFQDDLAALHQQIAEIKSYGNIDEPS